jgi:hypothetical protein
MNRSKSNWWFFVILMVWFTHVLTISIVWNFRIAQITKQPIFEQAKDKGYLFVALLFNQYYKKYDMVTRQNFFGGLNSFIYGFGSNYFRTDVAVSHITEKKNNSVTFSGTEVDDILFTLGRNFKLNSSGALTLSGLLGVPTHKIYRFQHVDFGYGQVGTGVQLDGIYSLKSKGDILAGVRYLHFFYRTASDSFNKKYAFSVGNVGDILVAYKNYWGKNGLEFGYTYRSQFGAGVCPRFDDIVEKTNYIRSNFYMVYKYKFLIHDIHNRILFNLAYGFDHKPKYYGNKSIVTLWTSWNISF